MYLLRFSLLLLFPSFINAQSINWMNFSQLAEAQKKEPRKVLIDIYTDWCGWCKKYDREVFTDQKLIEYLNKTYYCVKFNAEKDEVISFRDQNYGLELINGKKKVNALAYKLMNNRTAYPTIALLHENMELWASQPGFMELKEFETYMHYFGDNGYKSSPWQEFKSKFQQSESR